MNHQKATRYIGIACVIISFILMIAWMAGIQQWGDVFSLGQLLVDAIILPAAIISFIMTAEEFKETHTSPKLDFYWEIKPGKIEKETELSIPLPANIQSEQAVHDRGIRPVLINSRQAIAVWYMLSFDVPREICEHIPLRRAEQSWTGQLGEGSNWRQESLPDKLRVVFLSNGEIACYPGYPLPLRILSLSLAADKQSKEYKVPYTIVTDRGHTTKGSLLVRVKQISAEQHTA